MGTATQESGVASLHRVGLAICFGLLFLGRSQNGPGYVDSRGLHASVRKNRKEVALCLFGLPSQHSECTTSRAFIDQRADVYLGTPIANDRSDNVQSWLVEHKCDVGFLSAVRQPWLSGLASSDRGGAVFVLAMLETCLERIVVAEQTRGARYSQVIFARTDLFYMRKPVVGTVQLNQCWIPCPHNDWGGLCDQFAVCDRLAADAYANSSQVLCKHERAIARVMGTANSEAFLKLRLSRSKVHVSRGDDFFVRVCNCPSNVTCVTRRGGCQFDKSIGKWIKSSGNQLRHAQASRGIQWGSAQLTTPASVI